MISETRDYFAVYVNPGSVRCPDIGSLFERPVIAWDTEGFALVAHGGPGSGQLERATESPNFAGLRTPGVGLRDPGATLEAFAQQYAQMLADETAGLCEKGSDGTYRYVA